MTDEELKRVERATFRAAKDTGLWDLFLASFFALFAVAPLLSVRLGDFWSSAVFLPVWAAIYVAIRVVDRRVIAPRVGVIEVGAERRRRMRGLSLTMLIVNLVAFALGIFAATRSAAVQGSLFPFMLPITLLLGFSLAAFFLGIPRLFFYGVIAALAPLIGESLFRKGYVTHHGYPVTFGVASVIVFLCGLIRLWRVLPRGNSGSGELMREGHRE